MRNLLEALKRRLLVCDGAMGSQLMARGLEMGECPQAWNVERPEDVQAIHRSYLDAGADIILTNTFGGSTFKLMDYGLQDRAAELNTAAARLAREAAGEEKIVLGDVGPTGRFMAPLTADTFDDFYSVFKTQILALAGGGVDAIIVETMTSLEEAEAAVKAAKEKTDLPVIASMTFDRDADGVGFHTMMGVDIPSMVQRLSEAGADVLGTNCGNGIEDMIEIVRAMRSLTAKPLIAEPNAGVPELIGTETVYRQTPEEMAKHLDDMLDAGVNIVGGCCGTTPEHIRVVAERARTR